LIQSLFGIQAPKYIVGSTTVNLDHWITLDDGPEDDIIMHESIINRHREWVVKGQHWIFSGNLLLFKYADPQTKYDELKPDEYTLVDQLFRRRDGIAIKDAADAVVKFRVESIHETYIKDHPDYPDILRITFKSQDYIAMEKSVVAP